MKWRKAVLIGSLVVIILFVLTKIAEFFVERQYTNRPVPIAGSVQVTFSDVDLRPYMGGVELLNVRVADTTNSELQLNFGAVLIEGFRLWRFLTTREPRFRWVTLRDCDVDLELKQLVSDSVARLDTANPTLSLRIEELDLSFDREMNFTVTGSDIRDVAYRPDKGKYDVTVRQIGASDDGVSLLLHGFALVPRYTKYEFASTLGRRAGRVVATIPRLEIKRLNWNRLIRGDKGVKAHQVIAHGGEVTVFTDRSVPLDSSNYVELPHEQLLNTRKLIEIDTLSVRGASIRYSANNPKNGREGFIDFREVFANMFNITNVQSRIESRPLMQWQLRGKVFQKGELDVNIDFHLDREDLHFEWEGQFTRTSIDEIDSFIVPVANMNIVSGYNHGMQFAFQSDHERSVGTVDFEYSSLEIESLSLKESNQKRLITRFANVFLLKSNNMRRNRDYKQGSVDYEHETYRDLWHYLWTSIERGIMDIVLPKNIETLVEQVRVKRKSGHIGGQDFN